MAHAQYETRTRTVEETVVVLELTEDEASSLKGVLEALDYTGSLTSVLTALTKPEPPKTEKAAGTFELDGVVYELGAVYLDTEDSFFKFEEALSPIDGTPYGRLGFGSGPSRTWGGTMWSLAEVVRNYGPLRKV